jgi:excisionase family DNA binding protein
MPIEEIHEERLTYSVQETAELLGLSVNGTYDAVRQKIIPSLRIGRRIVIPKAALEAKLANVA